ncbi:hypothetical protein KUV26_08525 [Leisingera daeponensis]|uniref:Type II secretion system protein GspF domain-containing protein n=1 Tax=Leisingera daeponensis TaxID=405746 RepID=A0ABS7NE44_9RHOB|nr:hypothetical protein [Leisingera daeponensis]MBY6139474.1 hypothetical protein [Leisingera daeponensis]
MTHPARDPVRTGAKSALWAITGLVLLCAGVFGLFGRSEWNPLVSAAERTAEDIATSSVAVYVSLRAINAALSTAQEIEVGASVVGQASLQPLKILEPVDDTVERVADAVFIVAAGAALATVGLSPVVSIGLIILGAGMLGRTSAGLHPFFAGPVEQLCNRGIAFGFAVGLAMPLVFALGVWAGERATEARMSTAMAELEGVAQQAKILIGAEEEDTAEAARSEEGEAGVLEWLSGQITGVSDGISGVFEQSGRYLEAAQVFVEEADAILRASLTLIGILTLRMLVLPVFLLWGAMSLLRAVQRPAA